MRIVLRCLCLAVAVAIILIPAAISGITGNNFSETTSHIFISISLVALMGSALLGANKGRKNNLIRKLAICAGLLYVLVSQWI